MKILVAISGEKLNGIKFHRLVYPLSAMAEYHKDVDITVTGSTFQLSEKEIKAYDIAVLHAVYTTADEIRRLLVHGVKVVVDFDDYWKLSTTNEMYTKFKEAGEMKRLLGLFDYRIHVTTTTEALKRKILEHSILGSVSVLPNGMIDDDEYRNPLDNGTIEFGWVGGSTHTADLMKIKHLKGNYGIDTVFAPKNYAMIFKDSFDYYDPMKVPDYLNIYNVLDVVLVPLVKNEFNQYKSELKIVEAGFYKKPIIVSDVEPYRRFLKDGENCLVVHKHRDWAKHAKSLMSDKRLREKLGNNLYRDMKEHFDLKKITEKRYEYFKKIIQDV